MRTTRQRHVFARAPPRRRRPGTRCAPSALAHDPRGPVLQVHVREVQGHELRDAAPGGIQRLQHGPVPQLPEILAVRAGLVAGHLDQAAPSRPRKGTTAGASRCAGCGSPQKGWRATMSAPLHVAIPAAHAGDHPVHRTRREPLAVSQLTKPRASADPGILRGHAARAEERLVLLQVLAVGLEGMGGEVAHGAEIGEVVLTHSGHPPPRPLPSPRRRRTRLPGSSPRDFPVPALVLGVQVVAGRVDAGLVRAALPSSFSTRNHPHFGHLESVGLKYVTKSHVG